MHEHTPASDDAIESGEREFSQRLLVDWNNNRAYDHPLSDLSGYVATSTRDQTLTATAPSEIMLIEGYAAGSLKVELTGDYQGLSLAAHFAPYNGLSVFYTEGIALGVSMTYEIAVSTAAGWEWFPQFTGVVTDVSTDRETGTVSLDCLDNVERLRGSVDVAPYALFQSYLVNGFKRGGLVDSSSVIDLAARSGGFTMGPKTRWAWFGSKERTSTAGPIISVPFHGSVLPEIGLLDGDESFHLTEQWEKNAAQKPRAEAFTAGPHGYLAMNAVPAGQTTWNYKKYWIDEWNSQAGTCVGTWAMGCWVYWTGSNVDASSVVLDLRIRTNHFQLYVRGNDGGVEARIIENNGFVGWTNTPLRLGSVGWHYIEGHYLVYGADHYTLQVRIDEQTSTENDYTGRNCNDVNDYLSGLFRVEHQYAVSDVWVCQTPTLVNFGNWKYDTTPAGTAEVSWGRNRVTYTLRDDGREGWDLAKEVASAEYGVVFFDERGRFVFWNYTDMAARQANPLRTFTLDDLESLALRNTFDSVRNVWTVTTTTGRAYSDIAYDLANGVPFWRSADGQLYPANFQVPPYTGLGFSNSTWWFTVNDHVISVNPNDLWNSSPTDPNAMWEQAVPTHALMSYTGPNFQNQPPHSEQKLTTRSMARLTMSNGLGDPIGFLSPSNQPRFRIEGVMVHEDQPTTFSIRDEDSIDDYGERVIELNNNFWLQDEFQTRNMLADIVSHMGRPIPVSDTLTVPGDPRIQIGDAIQLQDMSGFGERMQLQVYGIRRAYSSEGLTDTYTVEMIQAAGVGAWDDPTYGLWDQSLIWS